MKNKDILIIKKMIKYCNDINTLMTRFDTDFERYKADIPALKKSLEGLCP